MYNFTPPSPVKPVDFGTALKFSLDNYYDLLKTQVGGLKADEFLQLKLVADTIDISPEKKASEGGYQWFSYYNLLNRSDRAISPTPIGGEITTGLESLAQNYEKFLRRLRGFVVVKVLSPADQIALADLDKTLESLKRSAMSFYKQDRTDWSDYAVAMGFELGDTAAYIQWSSTFGHVRDIELITGQIRQANFGKKTILDRQYPTLDDREIIDAEFDLENPSMRLRFPMWPDYTYPTGDQFSPTYLNQLPMGSTALFDDRRAATWDKTLPVIKTAGAGHFDVAMDRNTSESRSISTDWGGGGSVSYGFINVRASASQHTAIQSDFSKGQKLQLSAKSAMRININFPRWFRPTLFRNTHVTTNPMDFLEFFGPEGSLLYYPTALIVVRGFSVIFESSEDWKYDYQSQFSASGGGGFSAFGIGFGGSASYSSTVKEHTIDTTSTKLSISDDENTIRFVGFTVHKNDVISAPILDGLKKWTGD